MPSGKKQIDYDDDDEPNSPESEIVPSNDLNTQQERISGEKFPDVVLEICDDCKWCASCINEKAKQTSCPVCHKQVSRIPMSIDESCFFERDKKRGVTLHFIRKLPLR